MAYLNLAGSELFSPYFSIYKALTETLDQYNHVVLIPHVGLRAPNVDAKPVASVSGWRSS